MVRWDVMNGPLGGVKSRVPYDHVENLPKISIRTVAQVSDDDARISFLGLRRHLCSRWEHTSYLSQAPQAVPV